jgi:hypothetical protein
MTRLSFLQPLRSAVIFQVRGFAPFGMLEYWNYGKMGFGIPDCRVNSKKAVIYKAGAAQLEFSV